MENPVIVNDTVVRETNTKSSAKLSKIDSLEISVLITNLLKEPTSVDTDCKVWSFQNDKNQYKICLFERRIIIDFKSTEPGSSSEKIINRLIKEINNYLAKNKKTV